MRAVSPIQPNIDVLGSGYPRENVTQTVETLSKLTGTRGLIMVWTEVPLYGHTDPYVFPRGGIMKGRHRSDMLETIVSPHACANGDAFVLTHILLASHKWDASKNQTQPNIKFNIYL